MRDHEGRAALWKIDLTDKQDPQLIFASSRVDVRPVYTPDNRVLAVYPDSGSKDAFYVEPAAELLGEVLGRLFKDKMYYIQDMGDRFASYLRFTVQYVGSSFTQLGDEEPGFGVIREWPGGNNPGDGSARLIDLGNVDVTNIDFNPELPSYSIGNLRWGVSTDRWEAALFVNNIWDERAFLSVDRERGRSARVGYLTNQPRNYGVHFRMKF